VASPAVALVLFSALDLATFLPIARQLLGFSPASNADAKSLKKIAHQLACLEAFAKHNADGVLSAGFLIAAHDQDMREILQACSGMEYLITETLETNVSAVVIVGTLKQWRAIVSEVRSVKIVLAQVRKLLLAEGLHD